MLVLALYLRCFRPFYMCLIHLVLSAKNRIQVVIIIVERHQKKKKAESIKDVSKLILNNVQFS